MNTIWHENSVEIQVIQKIDGSRLSSHHLDCRFDFWHFCFYLHEPPSDSHRQKKKSTQALITYRLMLGVSTTILLKITACSLDGRFSGRSLNYNNFIWTLRISYKFLDDLHFVYLHFSNDFFLLQQLAALMNLTPCGKG